MPSSEAVINYVVVCISAVLTVSAMSVGVDGAGETPAVSVVSLHDTVVPGTLSHVPDCPHHTLNRYFSPILFVICLMPS